MPLRRFLPGRVAILLPRVKRAASRWVGARPVLPYVELHLTDHCNLNCNGCGHFASVAEPWYASPEEHASDMRQLSKLFSTIGMMRIMGGEPLLHPEVTSFLSSSRDCFPKTDIRLVTNGILIPQMGNEFWEALRKQDIQMDLTVYPPHREQVSSWIQRVRDKGVRIEYHTVEWFYAHKNLRGDSEPQRAFRLCRARYNVPFLREGKLYICSMPALVHHFNQRFKLDIPSSGFVDLYQKGLTGHGVLRQLEKPASTCRYCSYDWQAYPWKSDNPTLADWDASTHRPATQGEGADPLRVSGRKAKST